MSPIQDRPEFVDENALIKSDCCLGGGYQVAEVAHCQVLVVALPAVVSRRSQGCAIV